MTPESLLEGYKTPRSLARAEKQGFCSDCVASDLIRVQEVNQGPEMETNVLTFVSF